LRKPLLRIAGAVLVIASLVSAWLVIDFQHFRHEPLHIPEQGLSLAVRPGSSLKAIASEMVERQLMDHRHYFVVLGRLLDVDSRIQAGEYSVAAGTTPEQLLQQLADGKVLQHDITLIEGDNFRQMMERLRRDPVLEHTLQSDEPDQVMEAIGFPGIHPEGRFLPETYYFPRGTRDVDLLKRSYLDMESFLQQAWESRQDGLPLKTPYDALILASIVEEETGVPEERPRIAGVFVRRLAKGMKLQTDPTVIYGMGQRYDGDIRFRDLREDTPYNTYIRAGLPPTPIAMPGKDAILAALHPTDGKELFFVARGDGSHHFSATLSEHNKAVDRYQRKR
jgi:UPF0755 protein